MVMISFSLDLCAIFGWTCVLFSAGLLCYFVVCGFINRHRAVGTGWGGGLPPLKVLGVAGGSPQPGCPQDFVVRLSASSRF